MELTVESCVRGLHVYKDTWTPSVGEELPCKRETGNDRHVLVVLAAAFVIPLQRLLHVCVSSFELFLRKREGTFAGSVGTLLKYLNSAISESLRTLDLQTPPTEDLNDITQNIGGF